MKPLFDFDEQEWFQNFLIGQPFWRLFLFCFQYNIPSIIYQVIFFQSTYSFCKSVYNLFKLRDRKPYKGTVEILRKGYENEVGKLLRYYYENAKIRIENMKKLIGIVGYDKVQLVTISRPSAYGEYEPYHFVDTEEEFEQAVVKMK